MGRRKSLNKKRQCKRCGKYYHSEDFSKLKKHCCRFCFKVTPETDWTKLMLERDLAKLLSIPFMRLRGWGKAGWVKVWKEVGHTKFYDQAEVGRFMRDKLIYGRLEPEEARRRKLERQRRCMQRLRDARRQQLSAGK